MSMNNLATDTVLDFATLYELSMGIGTSLDLGDNCREFFRRLMSRCNFDSCALFLNKSEVHSSDPAPLNELLFECAYSIPTIDSRRGGPNFRKPLVDRLKNQGGFCIPVNETNQRKTDVDCDIDYTKGAVAFFPLPETGFLVCINSIRNTAYSKNELERYTALFNKFAFSIQACLEHERVQDHRDRLKKQFLHSQKMEVVGRLTGGIAHDFNNLLTVINGQSELLMATTEDNAHVHKLASFINEAGIRGAALTSQLLVYSCQHLTEPEVFDLCTLIEKAESLLKRILGADILIQTDLQPGLFVKADPCQLETAILNLAINARDAMPDGGKLKVDAKTKLIQTSDAVCAFVKSPGPFVELTIGDTGCGIAPENLGKIFDPYFTTKDVGAGSGLGLSVVQGAINEAGGHVGATSNVGEGSLFTIFLPFVSSDSCSLDSKEIPVADGGTETILLVEDEEMVRTTVTLALEMSGYHVLAADHAEMARDLARKHHKEIKLLISDVMMPDVNGKELANELCSLYPHWQLLFMSGYTDSQFLGLENINKCKFIQKPFSISSLSAMVKEMLLEPDGKLPEYHKNQVST